MREMNEECSSCRPLNLGCALFSFMLQNYYLETLAKHYDPGYSEWRLLLAENQGHYDNLYYYIPKELNKNIPHIT